MIQIHDCQELVPAFPHGRADSWKKLVSPEEIPESQDLFTAKALQEHIRGLGEKRLSVVAGGDIMLGGRTRPLIKKHGEDYPFLASLPVLRNAHIVLGNLEGPMARNVERQKRNFSYRVNPKRAIAMARAGISVLTLANNHLMDCGRDGVLQTMEAITKVGIHVLGAGVDAASSRAPVILDAGGIKVGLLGYYWNRRCAARRRLPGGAMDTPETLRADISRLKLLVDRIVVTFHWGIPYEREPLPDDRAKARLAVECGADAVIGHHPHVLQPFEIHRNRPIFYSIGNYAFGSGNSKGEGILVGLGFEKTVTRVIIYPLYVKNRDTRVAYQPKVLKGEGAQRVLARLAAMSGPSASFLNVNHYQGRMSIPYTIAEGEYA
jgi:poly-gamma-glutamate capsule biosynthesis protein CapA/YwtB (metallophosphatase superfamily)